MESPQSLWAGVAGGFSGGLQQSIAVATLIALIITVSITKMLSESAAKAVSASGKAPPTLGHWLPFIGHAPWLAFNRVSYLESLRDRFPEGIFSLWMMGKRHYFIHKPSLGTSFLNMQRPLAEDQKLANHLLASTFGFRKEELDLYSTMLPDAHAQYKFLLGEPGLGETVQTTLKGLEASITDFVTFNSYPSDQMDWERLADLDVIENGDGQGGNFVEADLMELVRNFVAKTASPALFGTDFVENFPDIWQFLWVFDRAFLLLAAGVPAWVPWPRLQSAKLARRKILAYTEEFGEALEKHLNGEDPGARWQDLDNVSRLVKGRAEQFSKHGLSLQSRASCDLALAWATNANSNPLITWMLFELCRDVVLLEEVREEIAPYVKAVQPKNEFGQAVWVPAKLESVDIEGLISKCPLFKSSYIETLRVYAGMWSFKKIHEDTVLHDRGSGESRSYVLEKGSYAHVVQETHQFDPKYFPFPKEWQADRHIKESVDEDGKKTRSADLGTIRPFGKLCCATWAHYTWEKTNFDCPKQIGGGSKMCKGRHFALREMLLYVAVIITFYDIQSPKGEPWKVPQTVKPLATRLPKKPLRVWIKRRELSPENEKDETLE